MCVRILWALNKCSSTQVLKTTRKTPITFECFLQKFNLKSIFSSNWILSIRPMVFLINMLKNLAQRLETKHDKTIFSPRVFNEYTMGSEYEIPSHIFLHFGGN